jgi:hypothetical protein
MGGGVVLAHCNGKRFLRLTWGHTDCRRRYRNGASDHHRLPHVEIQLELRHGARVHPEQAVLRQSDERTL